jgi:diacylglycerol kinase family enzyme
MLRDGLEFNPLTGVAGRDGVMPMHLALVVNRSAGTFRRLPVEATVAGVAQALRDGGHRVTVEVVGRRDLAAALSAVAARTDVDAVVVGGGDGSVLTAVLAGLGRQRPIGVLPLGTLNLFARDLGLPLDPVEAARLLASAGVAEIDLAEVNGLPFIIWASLGMHPWMVRRRDHLQREGMAKWPAMALAAFRALRRHPMIAVTLALGGGGAVALETPLMVITNNAWREETPPLSRAALDRGELEVHTARGSSRLALLWLAVRALLGRWRTSPLLDTYVAREVRVVTRSRRAMVSLDGEVTVLRSPLVFKVKPGALKVLKP